MATPNHTSSLLHTSAIKAPLGASTNESATNASSIFLNEATVQTITSVVAGNHSTTSGQLTVNDGYSVDDRSSSQTDWPLLWMPYFLLTLLLFGLVITSFLRFHMLNGHRYHRKKIHTADLDTEEESMDDDDVDDRHDILNEKRHHNYVPAVPTTDDIFQIENHAVDSTFEQFKLYPKVFNGHHMSLTASAESPKPNSHNGSSSRGCVPIILRRSESTGSILLETIYDTDV